MEDSCILRHDLLAKLTGKARAKAESHQKKLTLWKHISFTMTTGCSHLSALFKISFVITT